MRKHRFFLVVMALCLAMFAIRAGVAAHEMGTNIQSARTAQLDQ